MGMRNVTSGGLGQAVLWMTDPPIEAVYKAAGKRVIGALYAGASLGNGGQSVRSLDQAKYTGRYYESREEIMTWEARDSSARLDDRMEKMEADKVKQTLIEKTLVPLRELYTNLSDRGDWSGMKALEIAVSNALRRRTKPAPKGLY